MFKSYKTCHENMECHWGCRSHYLVFLQEFRTFLVCTDLRTLRSALYFELITESGNFKNSIKKCLAQDSDILSVGVHSGTCTSL